MSSLAELVGSRELVGNLTARELKGKYKGSALGWGWSLINPLATMAIFTLVFGLVLKANPPPGQKTGIDVYGVWLLCGLLPWTFLSNSMVGSINSLVANGNLIKKVYFPRETLILSTVLALGVTLLIELGVLCVALLFFGNVVLLTMPALVLLVLLVGVFATGLGLLLSVLNVYFRDMEYFVTIFLQLWFYATPIIYPATLVAKRLQNTNILGVNAYTLYEANPAARFVEAFRTVTYDLAWPSWQNWLILTLCSVVSLVLGFAVFSKFSGRLAEEL